MDLVGREEELRQLRDLVGSGIPVVRVSGPLQVGLTTLLAALTDAEGGLHLHVPDADRPQVLEALAGQLPGGAPVAGWDDLRQRIEALHAPMAALDGGLRLVRDDPAALEAFDAPGGPTVILAGDAPGTASGVTLPPEASLRVEALTYRHVRRLYPRMDEAERVRRYAVFGGLPGHHLFSRFAELEDAVHDSFLAETAPLREAVPRLLRRAGRSPTRFNSILRSLASGVDRLGALEEAVGVGRGGLGPYLETLRSELGLVEKADPILGGERSGRYRLRNPAVAFAYRFLFPAAADLEAGHADRVWARIRRALDAHVASVFPEVARDALRALQGTTFRGVPVAFDAIGASWDRAGTTLDLVAVGTDAVYAGDASWSPEPLRPPALRALAARATGLDAGTRRVVPVVVARGGLAWDARDLAAELGVLALDLDDVARILDRA